MSDNTKKKKLDSKRVAISQKHEVDYCKKIAKSIILNKQHFEGLPSMSIERLAKAFLKIRSELVEARRIISTNHSIIKVLHKNLNSHSKRLRAIERELKEGHMLAMPTTSDGK